MVAGNAQSECQSSSGHVPRQTYSSYYSTLEGRWGHSQWYLALATLSESESVQDTVNGAGTPLISLPLSLTLHAADSLYDLETSKFLCIVVQRGKKAKTN
ncbi:hypothetical protein LSTR_LSTR015498 [Laodelphax striatellus]|uniref:Uncharacterized protein n=1 Tax=Laodelphax striatellus TaxID=195883 RepID=A0A482WHJ5_LAOST|nr:hypothetical protein LSTR_LSTR015498 [Laodelphax striatellus]